MDRSERCEVLARLPEDDLEEIAGDLLAESDTEISVIQPPTTGMIMSRVVDGALGEQFNLGEVLVTECRVSVAGHDGWSMILGADLGRAFKAAAIDAALAAGHPQQEAIDAELRARVAALDAAGAADRQRLAATRVRFETQ